MRQVEIGDGAKRRGKILVPALTGVTGTPLVVPELDVADLGRSLAAYEGVLGFRRVVRGRLACGHWGRGYATEAARGALAHAFGPLGLNEIVAMAVPANTRSVSVMRRLGMTRSPADDFLHPSLPQGHPLRPHVLHRLKRSEWMETPGHGGGASKRNPADPDTPLA